MASNLVALADSLGWALVHSIWQVTLICALVFVALRITPRDNPQLRFALAYLGMAGSALAFLVTFFVYYGAASGGSAAAAPIGWAAYVEMLGKMTWLISLLWSLGFAALGTRYVQALRQTQRLRRVGVSEVPEKWESRFRLWLERLGGDPQASILYSDRVSTPVTIGAFKPVILVPAGFFLRMPAEQAEAVLVHEIAHICRQDYLLGLIQAMIANIFFFHPGIYYLSRQIDIEREYACDDRAARETGNAGPLAEALSRIAMQRDCEQLGFAMAADGPRTPIMDRINRLGRRPVSERGTSMPMAALSMAFAASLMIAIGADASIAKERDEGDTVGRTGADATKGAEEARVRPAYASQAEKRDESNWRATAEQEAPTSERRHAAHEDQCCADDKTPTLAEPERPAAFAISFSPSVSKARGPIPTAFLEEPAGQVRNAVHWEIDGGLDGVIEAALEEECEDTREARQEQAERRAERARERAERHAERARERTERHAERVQARAERYAARMERQAEQMAARLERQVERQAEHAERAAEREAEKAEHEAERRDQRLELQLNRRNGRLTISAAPTRPPAPAATARPAEAPEAPVVHSMTISIGSAFTF